MAHELLPLPFDPGPQVQTLIAAVRAACADVQARTPYRDLSNASLTDFGDAVERELPAMTAEWAHAFTENPALLDLGTDNVRAAMAECRDLIVQGLAELYLKGALAAI